MLHFGKMVDLARTGDEIKQETAQACPAPAKISAPVYPYGCCISLDDEVLKKLGLDGDLPEVGDEIHFCCEARVTSASQNECETPDGKKDVRQRVELQICRMSAPGQDPADAAVERSEKRQQNWYGGGDPDADGD